jgi:branched-chain amino acid transport system permease protein
MEPMSALLERHRWRWPEALFWLLPPLAFLLFTDHLALITQIFIMAIFALSLDLVLGFAGIVSLGHALFFGLGAYAAGLLAIAGWHEPISLVLAGGLVAALAAGLTGPLVLGLSGLPLIMATLALGVIGFEAANKLGFLTGGDNGLQGIALDPVLGRFRWSVYGHTAFFYALAWLVACFLLVRRVVASPFGVVLQGIRENPGRMRLIGVPVFASLWRAWVLGGALAGVAGALSAQTTQFVSLDALSLDNSIAVAVMLIVGGVGRLYGGLVGAALYLVVHDVAAEWNPYHWMFVIGFLLIAVVRFGRGGVLGIAEAGLLRARRLRA